MCGESASIPCPHMVQKQKVRKKNQSKHNGEGDKIKHTRMEKSFYSTKRF